MSLKRFGVSLEDNLLESLDQYVNENGFANRSQAIRFLIEKNVAERKWQCNHIVAGTIVISHDTFYLTIQFLLYLNYCLFFTQNNLVIHNCIDNRPILKQ